MVTLNEKQEIILNFVMNGKNTFITGFAGSGKSYLIDFICKEFDKQGKVYGLSAMTGCAAILINGTTLHNLLSIGLAKGDPIDLFKRIKKMGKLYYLSSIQVLIIDEVSMLSDILFDKINELFKLIKNNKLFFGGVQIILVGDMFQLKPIEGNYCFCSPNWELNTVILNENMRVQNDKIFEDLLTNIRWGQVTKDDYKLLLSMKETTFENGIIPTKLFSTIKEVDLINQYELNELKSEKVLYRLKKIKNTNIKIDDIILCVGAQVMITRNLDLAGGIVNGTRGIVMILNKDSVVLKLISGELYTLGYFHVNPMDDKNVNFKYLPLILSWALSIHKCQGATLDAIEINLGESIFADGQMYTAISRARNKCSVKITDLSKRSIKTNKEVIDFYQQK
jgi:ATP-dependent DNA helicase PIF1